MVDVPLIKLTTGVQIEVDVPGVPVPLLVGLAKVGVVWLGAGDWMLLLVYVKHMLPVTPAVPLTALASARHDVNMVGLADDGTGKVGEEDRLRRVEIVQ